MTDCYLDWTKSLIDSLVSSLCHDFTLTARAQLT